MKNLLDVDWSRLPPPTDDGAGAHLIGCPLPAIALGATDGRSVDLSQCKGWLIVYAFPMMGQPGIALPDGWDMIPGARGCTPQACAFRDHFAELLGVGAAAVYGLSVQSTSYQREAVDRLHLPFPLLSDHRLDLMNALNLPRFRVKDSTLLKRLTFIARDGIIAKVFYPVFPPDRNAAEVVEWLRSAGGET